MSLKGKEVEKQSFALIRAILEGFALPEYGRFIIERIVHASADFSLVPLVVITPGFVERFRETVVKPGYRVFCDVAMVRCGISPSLLRRSGMVLWEAVHNAECWQLAERAGITRAEAAVELAVKEGIRGFVFGNSPTGLLRLVSKIAGGYPVDWVVGCPVGFVMAAQAKEALLALGVPAVVLRGPRGGSPVAASIVNAVLAEIFGNGENGQDL